MDDKEQQIFGPVLTVLLSFHTNNVLCIYIHIWTGIFKGIHSSTRLHTSTLSSSLSSTFQLLTQYNALMCHHREDEPYFKSWFYYMCLSVMGTMQRLKMNDIIKASSFLMPLYAQGWTLIRDSSGRWLGGKCPRLLLQLESKWESKLLFILFM